MLYTVTLTHEELEALAGFIDAGLRATGLRSARMAANLADKLQSAINPGVPVVGEVKPNSKSPLIDNDYALRDGP